MQTVWMRRLAIVGIVAGVYVGLRYIFPVMIPFFIGWLMAVWMYPLVCRLERRLKVKRSVWAGIFMGILAFCVALLLYKGGEVLIVQLRTLISNYDRVEAYCGQFLNDCCHKMEELTGIPRMEIHDFFTRSVAKIKYNFLDDMGPDTFLQATDYIRGLIFLMSGVVIAVISGVLFVKDLADIRKQLRTFAFYPRWRRVLNRLKDTGAAYLKAQVLIMTVVALLCVGGMWLLGSPYYLLFGISLGILDALPIIGTGLFLYPAAIIFFLKGETILAAGCILIELITTVVREFLEPRLLGGRVGVYPVVIMAAIYVGFLLFGVMGFLLGPVGLLLIYAIGKEWDIWD